jgi:phosphoribosylaminoimidazole-succinocarboxamide synthase
VNDNVVMTTDLPDPFAKGKVRDTYDLGDKLLIVATDRISAFDFVLPNGVPRKGEVLSQLSAWWFERMRKVVPNHFVALITAENASLVPYEIPEELLGRSMLVRKAERLDAECIVRGYLSGSGWKDYQRTGAVCGIQLPGNLEESQRLDEPIFTPSTKAEVGHDENISYNELEELIGGEYANAARLRSLAVYNYGHEVARERGLIIADTKFEFGVWNEETILIDEVLTPDSSRFWPASQYEPGKSQPSFDKQPVRDWMAGTGWKDGDPVPAMPSDVVAATTERYLQVFEMLTGERLPEA